MTALKDCRVCGQPVAASAKTCPGCGAKKPTASKIEAGLDATGAAIVKLGLLLIMLAVVAVACLGIVACATDDTSRYTGDMCVDLPDGRVCGYTVTEICKKADGVMLTSGNCMIDGELWEFSDG